MATGRPSDITQNGMEVFALLIFCPSTTGDVQKD